MFGIGFLEILVIAGAALVLFGPQKLPEIMQQLGRYYVQIKRVTNDVKSGIDDAIKKAEYDLLIEERAKIQKLLDENQTKIEESAPLNPDHTEGLNAEPLDPAHEHHDPFANKPSNPADKSGL